MLLPWPQTRRSTRLPYAGWRTRFEKLWDAHVVRDEPGKPTLLYVDLHLVHEVTSPQAPLGRLLVGFLALAGGMVAVGTLTRFLLTPLLLIALVAGWAGASAGLLQTRARWRCKPGQARPW